MTFKKSSRGASPSALLLAAAITTACVHGVWAVDLDSSARIDIAAEPLADALIDLGRQMHIQIMSSSVMLDNHNVPTLQGSYSISQALTRLLSGTAYTYISIGPNTVAVITRPVGTRTALLSPNDAGALAAAGAATAGTGVREGASGGEAQSSGSDQLEQVVVTAERRSSDLQKAALAVTAISGADIERTGQTTYDTVLQNVPGVQMQESEAPGPPSPTIAIRGLGTDGQNKPPATAVYVDGVVLNREDADFYDLARVEVLRGPQGTLYGGSATGGAVNVVTNDPSFTAFSGSGQLDVGTYSALHTTGVVNLPLSDELAARFAFNEIKQANVADPAQGGGIDKLNARAKLLYRPSERLSLLLGFEEYNDKTGNGAEVLQAQDANGNLHGSKYAGTSYGSSNVEKYYANVTWDTGFGVITYIPAFQHLHSNVQSTTSLPAVGTDCRAKPSSCSYIITSADYYFPMVNLSTQELRIASGPSSAVTWVAGVYYADLNSEGYTNIGADNLLPITNELSIRDRDVSQSYAAFSQVTYPVSGAFRVTAGVRASADEVYWPQRVELMPPLTPVDVVIPSSFNRRYHSLDGLLRLETDLTPENLVYASASTAYRPGGPASDGQSYENERVRAFEFGSKNRFSQDRLQINAALYLNNYPNFQNNGTIYGPNNEQASAIAGVSARFYGVELESVMLPTANDRITLSPAWESARYTGNTVLVGALTGLGAVAESISTDGQSVPHAPRWNVSGRYDHTFPLAAGSALVASLDAHYETRQLVAFDGCAYTATVCAFDTAASPQLNYTAAQYWQPAYTLVDASLTFHSPGDRYSLTLYSRNLTNEVYKVGVAATYGVLGTPRVIGASVAARF